RSFGASGHVIEPVPDKKRNDQAIRSRMFRLSIAGRLGQINGALKIRNSLIKSAASQVHVAALHVNTFRHLYTLGGRKLRNQFECLTVVFESVKSGPDSRRVVSHLPEILNCATKFSSAFEMHGQLRGDPGKLVAVTFLQDLACLAVKLPATLAYQFFI